MWTLETLDWLCTLAVDWRSHFLASGSVGALVFLLTSIISYVLSQAWDTGTQWKENTGVDFSTVVFYLLLIIFWLGVPIASSLVVHGLLDDMLVWYTTPPGEPLELLFPKK